MPETIAQAATTLATLIKGGPAGWAAAVIMGLMWLVYTLAGADMERITDHIDADSITTVAEGLEIDRHLTVDYPELKAQVQANADSLDRVEWNGWTVCRSLGEECRKPPD